MDCTISAMSQQAEVTTVVTLDTLFTKLSDHLRRLPPDRRSAAMRDLGALRHHVTEVTTGGNNA